LNKVQRLPIHADGRRARPGRGLPEATGGHANLAQDLAGTGQAETTGDDNLRTLRLVFGAYESAATGQAIRFD